MKNFPPFGNKSFEILHNSCSEKRAKREEVYLRKIEVCAMLSLTEVLLKKLTDINPCASVAGSGDPGKLEPCLANMPTT